MDNARIGQRLRQLRIDRSLRQSDVAKQIGVSPAYLNLIEKGRRTIQFPLLWKALEHLGQDLESFMSSPPSARPGGARGRPRRSARQDPRARRGRPRAPPGRAEGGD